MFIYLIFQFLFAFIGLAAFIVFTFYFLRQKTVRAFISRRIVFLSLVVFFWALFAVFLSTKTYPPHFAMPPFMHSYAPGGLPASLPFYNVLNFFSHVNDFEQVSDISADPNAVPTQPQALDSDGVVRINLKAQEVISEIGPGIHQNYWTYNAQVPGPMLRVREGDTVEITLENDVSSLHEHSIDLHAVNGPGGGATLTRVAPGEAKTFRFKALNPGLYIYHCATPNVSTHNSHGQYGLILVDPIDPTLALPEVDKAFYIVQGEFYTIGEIGKRGLMAFDPDALIEGSPNYIVFNGKIEDVPRMKANVGDKIRIYVGNGGVNLISSFHVIGEIFDAVYPEANYGGMLEHNVQTTAVLPGGASIVEFTIDVPGNYLLVDHALARLNKGAWAVLEVTGDENSDLFSSLD